MKILFLIGGLGCGGAPKQFMELVKRVGDKGVDPLVVTLERSMPDFEDYFDRLKIRHARLYRKGMLDFRVCSKIAALCHEEKVDAIHTWQPLAGIYGVVVAKLTRLPLVCSTIQDAKVKNSPLEWLSKRIQAASSDIFVGNNEEGLIGQFGRMRDNFRFIGNGIDVDRLTGVGSNAVDAIRERYSCADTFNVGMVANYSYFRDPYTFIDAVGLLSLRNPKVRGFLVGDGPIMPKITEYIRQREYGGLIHCTGLIPHGVEAYIKLFDACVLLVNASVIQEGMSNFLMEAMIMGKPVVATRGGGNLSLIKEGVTGYMVEPYDVKGLADTLWKISSEDHSAMSRAASTDITGRYNMGDYVASYVKCYREVLGDRYQGDATKQQPACGSNGARCCR